MAKIITKTHLTDADGNLIAPGTEIEETLLGNAETIARYKSLEAVEAVIVTGEAAEEAAVGVLDDSFEELNRHTRTELVEMAAAEKVEIGEKDTKAQIIEKILAARVQ